MNIRRRHFLQLPVAALLQPALFAAEQNATGEFYFQRDHIMGTSLDLAVEADSRAAAEAAEDAVLNEISRLSRLLSTYDETSEISRLNRASGSVSLSPELFAVLREYQNWNRRTNGALACGASFAIDPANRTATRAGAGNLNIDALGKSWILERATSAARRESSSVMLDIGGDICVSSAAKREVAVDIADPFRSWENAPPLSRIRIFSGAVATSGTSMRGAHIIDPRTGLPARGVASATVIAPDAVTANALSTAAWVLGCRAGMNLIERTPNAEAIMIAADGEQFRSNGFDRFESPVAIRTQGESKWPAGWAVNINVPLTAGGWRRPYLAVWAEDMNGHLVKNIALFASKPRYLNELRGWYSANYDGGGNWRSVARPTRGPGDYSFGWDGVDDRGRPALEGSYRIFVECVMEHGQYYKQSAVIACTDKPSAATVRRTGYFDDVAVHYGPGTNRG
ncbi:MAG TPA: DUF2271 domain-containing protein [Bryobacteraceae bacterium]|nr:DUF2271 domain-containing protein [Bryobacteraceae bacterium]